MSSNIQVSKAPATELFKSDKVSIGFGAVIIDLKTCDIVLNPTITIDNAAKMAAKQIYNALRHEDPLTEEPEWVNKVTFAAEGLEDTPAIQVIDDKWYYHAPPFVASKKNISFWTMFTKYWNLMVVQAMTRALVNRSRSIKENERMTKFAKNEI